MAHDLIPADVRSRLKDLRLTARRAIGAQGIGVHHSRRRGAGLEFAQYRAYEPGDELRQIDWKLYARSDRFFVREAERESPLTVWIVLDATASMAQRDGARGTRFDTARSLAACIAGLNKWASWRKYGTATTSCSPMNARSPGSSAKADSTPGL